MTVLPIRRALISVSDKTGLLPFATALAEAGVRLVSTGSTAAALRAGGLAVMEVADLTGFPECLDGRVKTLHPRVHAGILADRTRESHVWELAELGVEPFDLVAVNLYPFAATVASGAGREECIENIDIGGPAMVRAAAKNYQSVAVVVRPSDYDEVVAAVRAGGLTEGQRANYAMAAFRHTASYDVAVASWFGEQLEGQLPSWRGEVYQLARSLRYGENPHQLAGLYLDGTGGLAGAVQLGGKEMSFNNYQDAEAAIRAAYDHERPAVAIIKHANPCGIAVGDTVAEAHRRAHACDPVSAFGGVIAANRQLDREAAEQISPVFTEVVAAPSFTTEALEVLGAKKALRIVQLAPPEPGRWEERRISGGVLVQERDGLDAAGFRPDGTEYGDDPARWQLVAGPGVAPAALEDLAFAWRAVRAVKSNAILLARAGASVGVGMGQVNRVDAAHLAVTRANSLGAGERSRGAVAASDAFFPFADGLQVLIDAGVCAVVAPGGSVRDGEVIAAAGAAGVSLYFTGTRHFAH